MKTLSNHTLVYDSECPMCDLYTRGFIKTGMLDRNGRVAYGNAKVPVTFDNTRARNEIALIDYDNGTVTYGLDSLIKVIANSFPGLGKLLKLSCVRAPLDVLYSFISYNRKVIAPPKVFERRGSCTPEYRVGYRIAYIVFAWLVTSLVLSHWFDLFLVSYINGVQILFQLAVIQLLAPEKTLHYIGNLMTVVFIASLLLLPLACLENLPAWMMRTWFAIVMMFAGVLLLRRLRYLELCNN